MRLLPSRRSFASAAAVLVGLSACTVRAAAQTTSPTVTSLVWTRGSGAEQCVDADALRAAVQARLGRSVFAPSAPLQIRGQVERAEHGFDVRIELALDGEVVGQRVLHSERPRCDALDDSLAVVIALLVEVGEQTVTLALAAPTVEAREPVETREPAVRLPVAAPREPARAPGFSLSVGALATGGALPGLAFAPHAAFELVLAPLSLRVEAAYAPEVGLDLGQGRAARLALGWAGLGACLDARVIDRVSLGGCAGLRGGAVVGLGLGFDVAQSGLLPWLVATVSGRARWLVVRPVGVELALGLDVPLLRDRFVASAFDGTTREVYAPPHVAPFVVVSLILVVDGAR